MTPRQPEPMLSGLPEQLVSQLKAVFKEDASADCIALYWQQPLVAQAQLVDGKTVQVVFCESELALREQLVQHNPADDRRLLLLWPWDRSRLGKDVLARLWGNDAKHIAPWRMLEQLLGVKHIDPRLRGGNYRWLAEQLLTCHERYRRHIRFGPTLDFDRAWQALALGLLDFDEPSLDLQSLLTWSLKEATAEKVAALRPEVQDRLSDWMAPRLGELSPVLELLLRNGYADKLVVVGLVCTVLYEDETSTEQTLYKARGRFSERFFNGEHCTDTQLRAFGEAVRRFVTEQSKQRQPIFERCFGESEQELARLDMSSESLASDLLPGSFELRLQAFAEALATTFAQAQAGKTSPLARDALQLLRKHRLADELREQQLHRAQHAVRLCAWLQTPAREASSLNDLLGVYVSDGGFVDWARSRLWVGDENEKLSALYQRILKKIAVRREAENAQIVPHLPNLARGAQLAAGDFSVEQALDAWVAPLAKQQPVLMLVLDGMSQAVYRELQDDLLRHRWVELQPQGAQRAGCLLAALPSVTKYSRHSLLSGKLSEGNSSTEKKAFDAHEGLRLAGGGAQYRPKLLHKAELQEPGVGGLATAVRELIAETDRKVVAAVVNAVDDQLSSNAQLAVQWQVKSIELLRALLEAARESGRVLLICSDHGHVLDHGMLEKSSGFEAERYKPGDSTLQEGEALVEGARVLSGGSAVVPFTERLRYAKKKMGYHGGACLQELVIPTGVYIAAGQTVDMQGWNEIAQQLPTWWTFDESAVPVEVPPPTVKAPSGKAKKDERTDDMFAGLELAVAAPKQEWVSALFASVVYLEMKTRAGRSVISDQQLHTLLLYLEQRAGQQMVAGVAQALGVPAIRVNGVLAGAQKLLNVDGYPVLSVDRASKTVKLDVASLKLQFEL